MKSLGGGGGASAAATALLLLLTLSLDIVDVVNAEDTDAYGYACPDTYFDWNDGRHGMDIWTFTPGWKVNPNSSDPEGDMFELFKEIIDQRAALNTKVLAINAAYDSTFISVYLSHLLIPIPSSFLPFSPYTYLFVCCFVN